MAASKGYFTHAEEHLEPLLEQALSNFGLQHQQQARKGVRLYLTYAASQGPSNQSFLLRSLEHCILHYDGGLRDNGLPALLHPLTIFREFYESRLALDGSTRQAGKHRHRKKSNPYKVYLAAAGLLHDEREENLDRQRQFQDEFGRLGLPIKLWPWPWGLPSGSHDPYYDHRLKDGLSAYGPLEANPVTLHKWINLLKNIRRDADEEDYIEYLQGTLDKVQTRKTLFDAEQQRCIAFLKWQDRGCNIRDTVIHTGREWPAVQETLDTQQRFHELARRIEADKLDHFIHANEQGLPSPRIDALGREWWDTRLALLTAEANLLKLDRLAGQIAKQHDNADDGVIPVYGPFKMNWEILKNDMTIAVLRTKFRYSRSLKHSEGSIFSPPLRRDERKSLDATVEAARRNQRTKSRALERAGATRAELAQIEYLAGEFREHDGLVARTSFRPGGPSFAIFDGTLDEIFELKRKIDAGETLERDIDPMRLYQHATLLKVWSEWLLDDDHLTRLTYRLT